MSNKPSVSHVLFQWHLVSKATNPFKYYYAIQDFVDHDTANLQVLDWHGGDFNYDGQEYNHTGTDILMWPYRWSQIEHKYVKIVAAAPEILIDKHGGEYDRNCGSNSLTPN